MIDKITRMIREHRKNTPIVTKIILTKKAHDQLVEDFNKQMRSPVATCITTFLGFPVEIDDEKCTKLNVEAIIEGEPYNSDINKTLKDTHMPKPKHLIAWCKTHDVKLIPTGNLMSPFKCPKAKEEVIEGESLPVEVCEFCYIQVEEE